MTIRKLFDLLFGRQSYRSNQPAQRVATHPRTVSCRLAVELLEERWVPASLSVGDVTVIEGVSGTKNAEVIVSLSEPSSKTVSVRYATANGTAFAGSDYTKANGRLSFAPGQVSQKILVPIQGNRVIEPSERFIVNLSQVKNAIITDDQAIVTILDSSPVIRISHQQTTASEADQLMTFTVNLSVAYDQAVTVNFHTVDGYSEPEYADGAIAGEDYVAASGTLTFSPGETTKTITIRILGDSVPEFDECFYVFFSDASANAQINIIPYGQGFIFGELGTPM